jgi:peptidoglycan-associated lipoprotein
MVMEEGTVVRLDNIYYDYDKWEIRSDAAIELNKLVTIMEDNPSMTIELGSHTDSRGSPAYNSALSQKRAQAVVDYLTDKGVAKNRIKSKGYGESKILNKCVEGAECSEDDHQLNRRTEFKILKI